MGKHVGTASPAGYGDFLRDLLSPQEIAARLQAWGEPAQD